MMQAPIDTQSLFERAAVAMGVPFSPAARFAAGAVRHLIARRDTDVLEHALRRPEDILAIVREADLAIETASTTGKPWEGSSQAPELFKSMLEALPCASTVAISGDHVIARIELDAASGHSRPRHIRVPDGLVSKLQKLSVVGMPDAKMPPGQIEAGASLMQLD